MARQNDHNRAEELISAYLDKRVSAEEQDFFERHIASCADCRAQLEATRSMVGALRAMPIVKAPRSFVLPRAMAQQPKRLSFSLYPALRLATVAAALAFVVLFAGDLLISRSGTSSVLQSLPNAAPVPAALQAPEAARQIAPTTAPAAPPAAAPTQAPAAAEAYNAATTAPAQPAAPGVGAAAQTSATAIVTESKAVTLTTATPEATAAADAALPAQPQLRATPEPTAPALAQRAAPASEQTGAVNKAEATPAIDTLRVIEIAVLVLVIALGIATLVARRRQA